MAAPKQTLSSASGDSNALPSPQWFETFQMDVHALCELYHNSQDAIRVQGIDAFFNYVMHTPPFSAIPRNFLRTLLDRIVSGELTSSNGYFSKYQVCESTCLPFLPVKEDEQGVMVASMLSGWSDQDGCVVSKFWKDDNEEDWESLRKIGPWFSRLLVSKKTSFVLELIHPAQGVPHDILEMKMTVSLMFHELLRMHFLDTFRKSIGRTGSPTLAEWCLLTKLTVIRAYPKKEKAVDFLFDLVSREYSGDLNQELTLMQVVDRVATVVRNASFSSIGHVSRIAKLELNSAKQMRDRYLLLEQRKSVVTREADFLKDTENPLDENDFRSRMILLRELTARLDRESKEEKEMKHHLERLRMATAGLTQGMGTRRKSEPGERAAKIIQGLAGLIASDGRVDMKHPLFGHLRQVMDEADESDDHQERERFYRRRNSVQQTTHSERNRGNNFAGFNAENQSLSFGHTREYDCEYEQKRSPRNERRRPRRRVGRKRRDSVDDLEYYEDSVERRGRRCGYDSDHEERF